MELKKVCLAILFNSPLLSFGQFEEQFLKTHPKDSIKDIKVWFFNYNTKVDTAKHQGYRYYTFDLKSNKITGSCINEKNILLWKDKYYYDSLNRISKKISYSREYGNDTTLFEYNNNGIAEINPKNLVGASGTTKIDFDTDSNMIQVTSFSNGEQETVDRYEYTKFDKKGNWTEMIWYMNDAPFRTFIRKLTYYSARYKK
jgi:hypothetical protein